MHKSLFFWSLSLLILQACGKSEPSDQQVTWLDSKHRVVFLHQEAAVEALLTDTSDLFFQHVGIVDMCLQMGEKTSTQARDSVLLRYQNWLRQEADAFNMVEMGLVSSAVHRAFKQVQDRLPGVFPAEFGLAKIKGRAYGPMAYFTREDVIFIPAQELAGNDPEYLSKVIIHEIWHIISRRNPQIRNEVYAAFGFEPLDAPLLPDSSFAQRQLLNPDAQQAGWYISLQTDSALLKAVPLAYTKQADIAAGQTFFDHFAFAYFPVVKSEAGWVPQEAQGFMPTTLPDFRQKTGGNTNYIIHPEEIAADNLVLLATEQKEGISADGQAAIKRLEEALWKWVSAKKRKR